MVANLSTSCTKDASLLKASRILSNVIVLTRMGFSQLSAQEPIEITTSMKIDVDGAPNAYGSKTKKTLDYELNAHEGASADGRIVGYITKEDGSTPEIQGPNDPYPGYYISTSGFFDRSNPNRLDPDRYLDASKINYVVLSTFARKGGAEFPWETSSPFTATRPRKVSSGLSEIPATHPAPKALSPCSRRLDIRSRTERLAKSARRKSSFAIFRNPIRARNSMRPKNRSTTRLNPSDCIGVFLARIKRRETALPSAGSTQFSDDLLLNGRPPIILRIPDSLSKANGKHSESYRIAESNWKAI
jgi:hypothetical protein